MAEKTEELKKANIEVRKTQSERDEALEAVGEARRKDRNLSQGA